MRGCHRPEMTTIAVLFHNARRLLSFTARVPLHARNFPLTSWPPASGSDAAGSREAAVCSRFAGTHGPVDCRRYAAGRLPANRCIERHGFHDIA
jgi:hypothetical protein